MPSAQHVKVEMRNCLAAIRAVVDDDSKAGFMQAFGFRRHLGDANQVPKQRFVVQFRGRNARDFLLGHDEEVHRSLRRNVVKRQAAIILKNNAGRDFAADDLGE